MKILILSDAHSWIHRYLPVFRDELQSQGHSVDLLPAHTDAPVGHELCFLLSYSRIVRADFLSRHRHNLVVHESALPAGKGMSPMSWQVLEGKNLIPITLFEAAETVDAGVVYARGEIALEGHELVDELRAKQWDKTRELLLGFLKRHPHNVGVAQTGEESFYPRRGPADGRLDLDRPLREQFNLLRISDNERYPAFFEAAGHRYVLKIEKVPHG